MNTGKQTKTERTEAGTLALFCAAVMLITLTVSFPLCSLLLFAAFPTVLALLKKHRPAHRVLMLLCLIAAVCAIVCFNAFFIKNQPMLFLLMTLYFSCLLSADFLIAFYAFTTAHPIPLIFGYIAASRGILCMSTTLFPFYWTLTMHLVSFMGIVSRFVQPLLWEALCVTYAALIYLIKPIQSHTEL